MSYTNLDNYKDEIKKYVIDSLEQRRLLEMSLIRKTKSIFVSTIKPVISTILSQQGDFKGIDNHLHQLFEKAKKELNEKLGFLIYETLKSGASIALSVSARLKVDEEISNWEHAVTGEARSASPPTRDKNVIVKKIQSDVSKKSTEIAQHTFEKKRMFREKEFTISSRVWDLSKHSIETIKGVCEAGINMDCKKLAKVLDEYVATGSSKPIKEYPNMMARLGNRFPPDTSFAAMRLARNEQSENYFATSIKDYMENPYVEAVQWLLANNRLKMYEDRCDCNDIAYEDVYGLGRGIYPLDKVPDRPHVMCLCTLAPITSRKLKKHLEGGMKLGNVPTKEWFEKQNHEDNIELIKSKYTETGLKLFHNEEGKALGLASIDIIKEHKWFVDGVRTEDKRAFLDDLHKVNGRALYILAKHAGDMQVEFYSTYNGSFYLPKENKIYCNLIKDSKKKDNQALEFKLGMRTFLHEAGHWLDSNIYNEMGGLRKKMPYLSAYITKDVLNYINKTGYDVIGNAYKPITKDLLTQKNIIHEKIRQKIIQDIRINNEINSNISDLYGSKTENHIRTDFYHRVGYWCEYDITLHSDRVTSEAIAKMFESLGHPERIKAMRQFLPNAWMYFNMILNEVF